MAVEALAGLGGDVGEDSMATKADDIHPWNDPLRVTGQIGGAARHGGFIKEELPTH